MKSSKQKTFEEWMDEEITVANLVGDEKVSTTRKEMTSIPRYNFAKEVWAAASGKFKSDDEVSDEV